MSVQVCITQFCTHHSLGPCHFHSRDCTVGDKLDLDVHHSALTEERIAALHAAGIRVNCWTVDDKDRAEELAAWGVDYITSNILEAEA